MLRRQIILLSATYQTITNLWQAGELDVDGSLYEKMKKYMSEIIEDPEPIVDIGDKVNYSGKDSLEP